MKFLKITSCENCPCSVIYYGAGVGYCRYKEDKIEKSYLRYKEGDKSVLIMNFLIIPDWCPLED